MPKRPRSWSGKPGPWASGYRKYAKRAKTVAVVTVPRSKFRFGAGKNTQVFPKKMRQTLVICDILKGSLSDGSISTSANWYYSTNGLYDPYLGAGGHQPNGFDQLAAMYERYVVVGAKITVMPLAPSPFAYCGSYGVNLTDLNTATSSSAATEIESQYSSFGLFQQTGGLSKVQLGCDNAKYFGVTDILDAENLGSVCGANPLKQGRFYVWAQGEGSEASSKMIHLYLKIEYDVIFLEPKNVAPS